jgi:hypothetical protein
MNKNMKAIASILGGLLVVLMILPILTGGTEGTLFTVLLWVLALGIVTRLILRLPIGATRVSGPLC